MNTRQVVYRFHATRRMFERKISEREVSDVLDRGKVIEDYPTDQPYPSRLMLGFCEGRALHVVVADARDLSTTIVITVYEPNIKAWEPGFERRKK